MFPIFFPLVIIRTWAFSTQSLKLVFWSDVQTASEQVSHLTHHCHSPAPVHLLSTQALCQPVTQHRSHLLYHTVSYERFGFQRVMTVPSEHRPILSSHFIGPWAYFLKNRSFSAPGLGFSPHHPLQVVWELLLTCHNNVFVSSLSSPFLTESQSSVWSLCSEAA